MPLTSEDLDFLFLCDFSIDQVRVMRKLAIEHNYDPDVMFSTSEPVFKEYIKAFIQEGLISGKVSEDQLMTAIMQSNPSDELESKELERLARIIRDNTGEISQEQKATAGASIMFPAFAPSLIERAKEFIYNSASLMMSGHSSDEAVFSVMEENMTLKNQQKDLEDSREFANAARRYLKKRCG